MGLLCQLRLLRPKHITRTLPGRISIRIASGSNARANLSGEPRNSTSGSDTGKVKSAFRAGFTLQDIHRLTNIDPWFLQNIKEIIDMEDELVKAGSLEMLT
jgi:hypothetical protein